MAQNGYYPGNEGYYYMATPSPQQSILSSNTYASQQTTPQTDHSDFGFSDSAIASRSNSDAYLYQQQVVPQLQSAIILPQGIPISHLRTEDKTKANKRTQCACENCRNKKSKCDGGQPCQGCQEANVPCKYREIPPSKKDNQLHDLLDLMQSHNKELRRLMGRIDEIDQRLERVEQRTEQRACWQCGTSQYPPFQ